MTTSKKIHFDKIVTEDSNLASLRGLVFDKRDLLGVAGYFDMRNVSSYEALTRELIAALDEHSTPAQIASDLSIHRYAQAIRTFVSYCEINQCSTGFRMKDITTEFLLNYRAYLAQTTVHQKSGTRRRLYGNLLRLIHAAQSLNYLDSQLRLPANFHYLDDNDITQPYTSGEALDIENACRNNIRELQNRLDIGNELLKKGSDPRVKPTRDKKGQIIPIPLQDRPWVQLPNLLWFVVNVLNGGFVKNMGRAGSGLSSFRNATAGAWKSQYNKTDVYEHLYPTPEDLIPFVIMLGKKTGRNESSILGLKRDCLQEIDGRYILWYRKERGSQRLYRKVISDDGPFSPVALIKMILRFTTPVVAQVSAEDRDFLFIALTTHAIKAPFKRLAATYLKSQMNNESGWCARNKLQNDDGTPLKISMIRLRSTYLTKRYRAHGQLARVSRDAAHSLSKTTLGYIANDATKHIHEDAIRAGIREALKLAKPVVISEDSLNDAAKVLMSDELTAGEILRGEQDVFFAACRDFYNPPDGPSNTPCDKPWGCFGCGNAVITRHVLPRVIAFKDFVKSQRDELHKDDWDVKFGTVWDVINNSILPKFSKEAIFEAEQQAASNRFYIPLQFKA